MNHSFLIFKNFKTTYERWANVNMTPSDNNKSNLQSDDFTDDEQVRGLYKHIARVRLHRKQYQLMHSDKAKRIYKQINDYKININNKFNSKKPLPLQKVLDTLSQLNEFVTSHMNLTFMESAHVYMKTKALLHYMEVVPHAVKLYSWANTSLSQNDLIFHQVFALINMKKYMLFSLEHHDKAPLDSAIIFSSNLTTIIRDIKYMLKTAILYYLYPKILASHENSTDVGLKPQDFESIEFVHKSFSDDEITKTIHALKLKAITLHGNALINIKVHYAPSFNDDMTSEHGTIFADVINIKHCQLFKGHYGHNWIYSTKLLHILENEHQKK